MYFEVSCFYVFVLFVVACSVFVRYIIDMCF